MNELNLLDDPQPPPDPAAPAAPTMQAGKSFTVSAPYNLDEVREAARGDLARGLLWLLAFAIGGVLVFVGLGRLEGTVITQSIFPSLVALAGTALGFYFGSSAKSSDAGTAPLSVPSGAVSGASNRTPPAANAGPDQSVATGATVKLNGTCSAGAGGALPTFAWTLTTIPTGSTAKLTGENTPAATFVADQPGGYVAQLVVNDGLASTPSMTNVIAS